MSKRKLQVGIVFGGRSGEHEVSLQSARSVMQAIDATRYDVVPIAIDKAGRWLIGGQSARLLEGIPGQAVQEGDLSRAGLVPRDESLRQLDVVFPVLHGPMGEDGTVQGLLELADIPYVGCGVMASAVAMDKAICKAVFAAHGLPQIPHLVVKRKHWEADPRLVLEQIEARFVYPMFVKPANLGSSVGISKVKQREQLAQGLDTAAHYDRKMVVEQGVVETREIEVSVLGNDEPMASVPGEIVPCREFYDYAAKYVEADSELIIPAPISEQLADEARRLAVAAFLALDAAGLARVDFLLDRITERLYVNEVNTIPGFTAISMYPKLWEASGVSYPELIDRLIDLALERHGDKRRSKMSYEHGPNMEQP